MNVLWMEERSFNLQTSHLCIAGTTAALDERNDVPDLRTTERRRKSGCMLVVGHGEQKSRGRMVANEEHAKM